MEAAVQVVCSSNDSNLHDNGHSVEPAPLTALADKPADGFQGRSTGFGSVTCRSDSTIFRGFYVRSWQGK